MVRLRSQNADRTGRVRGMHGRLPWWPSFHFSHRHQGQCTWTTQLRELLLLCPSVSSCFRPETPRLLHMCSMIRNMFLLSLFFSSFVPVGRAIWWCSLHPLLVAVPPLFLSSLQLTSPCWCLLVLFRKPPSLTKRVCVTVDLEGFDFDVSLAEKSLESRMCVTSYEYFIFPGVVPSLQRF